MYRAVAGDGLVIRIRPPAQVLVSPPKPKPKLDAATSPESAILRQTICDSQLGIFIIPNLAQPDGADIPPPASPPVLCMSAIIKSPTAKPTGLVKVIPVDEAKAVVCTDWNSGIAILSYF
jgi:hypothetical protein